MRTTAVLVAALVVSARDAPSAAPTPLALPGGEGGIGFDDLRFSRELHRVIVPAGRTGRVDLVAPGTGALESIEAFQATASRARGHEVGTTSADAGGGTVFAIDRTTRTLAALDPRTRSVVARTKLAGGPDYVRWVEGAGEVWVTEPDRETVETFRFEPGPKPALSGTGAIAVPGGPESLVVDPASSRAYTNTFRDATVAIDTRSHAVVGRWANGCAGARGIALDAARGLVFVGCAEGKAVALDVAHGGKVVGEAKTGKGVDAIEFGAERSHLYVPAAGPGTLSILRVDASGALEPLEPVLAAPGAHCVAVDDQANVYVCDPGRGGLLVVRDPHPPSR
jgi:DNA-binding beta-propeller fold protein YncE